MCKFLQRAKVDEKGNVGILFAMFSFMGCGLLGLSIDYGRSLTVSAHLQSALDSAVLAASNPDVADVDRVARAEQYFDLNFAAGGGQSTSNVSRSFSLSNGSITGSAGADVGTTFAQIVGVSKLAIGTESRAKLGATTTRTVTEDVTKTETKPGALPCILVLDPSIPSAFKMISNSNLNASTCDVGVRSNDMFAYYNDSSSSVKFANLKVRGGYRHIGGGKPSIVKEPKKVEVGVAVPSGDAAWVVRTDPDVPHDPYKDEIHDIARSLHSTIGACSSTNTDKTYTGSLSPGTFCGETVFNNATFAKGIYIIANKANKRGNLSLKGSLNGKAGVTFYLSDAQGQLVSYAGGEGSVLVAPAEGATQGILFMQELGSGNNWALTINSVNKNSWTGLVYFPRLDLTTHSLSEWPKMNVSIVLNSWYMDSLSTVFSPYSWVPWGKTVAITYPGTTTTTTTTVTRTETATTPGMITH